MTAVAQQSGGEAGCGIGSRLRSARAKRGLALLGAAEKLHVDARLLEALEAEDFAALGADVYVRGHLRRYAELVGESPAELQELYLHSSQTQGPDLTHIMRTEHPREHSRLIVPAILVLVGFALAGLLSWMLGEKNRRVSVAPPVPVQEAPVAPVTPTTPPQLATSLPSTPSTPLAATPGLAHETQLTLQLAAESWVEISDVDGRQLLQGLIEAGSARRASGTPPLRLVLGNAPAVALQINGQAVTLAGLVRRDGSAHVLIDDTGRVSPAPPRLAHGD